MDPRLDQFLQTLNRHRVALGGLAVALTLGVMTGGFLKPAGLLEPTAAQLIASPAQASNAPAPLVLEAFPTNTGKRPWVYGTDYAKLDSELPRIAAYYDDPSYEQSYAPTVDETMPLPDSTPSVADRAVDAVATESSREDPA
jgi:hypothetical protein